MELNLLHSDGLFRPEVHGDIRRITIGGLQSEFNFHVGQVLIKSGVQITKIERDENAMFLFGEVMYIIYAKKTGLEDSKEKAWKYIHGLPVLVENFI